MRAAGIRYAFISNSDNLGATCDPDIAAWLIADKGAATDVFAGLHFAGEAEGGGASGTGRVTGFWAA